MRKLLILISLLLGSLPLMVHAGEPTVANPDHEAMLRSDDPELEANKRLVYDFWREVVESGIYGKTGIGRNPTCYFVYS